MKTDIRSLIYSMATLVMFILLFPACEDTDYLKYDIGQKNQLCFAEDSLNFIYEFRSDEDVDLEVMINVLGFVNEAEDTPFAVNINKELTNAVEGTHFKLIDNPVVAKDSTRGYVQLDFIKSNLELDKQYILTLDLIENDNYEPANTKQCKIYFGNLQIPAPVWWRAEYLADYTQEKFVRFVELYTETKTTSPYFYNNINNLWGPTLQGRHSRDLYLLTTSAYQGYFTRYIFGPIYDYYLETNDPKYAIPNPY